MVFRYANCGNVSKAVLEVKPRQLNVVYGINGTGKSTIAKAIKTVAGKGDFSILQPYTGGMPSVSTDPDLGNVLVFDEGFLNANSVFLDDGNLLQDGHKLFIETPGYVEACKRTERQLSTITRTFRDNKSIESLIHVLDGFLSSYGKNLETKNVPANSPIMKSTLSKNNNVTSVPERFSAHKAYIQAGNAAAWLTWHEKGTKSYVLEDTCPYCGAELTSEHARTLADMDDEYGGNLLKHTANVNAAFNNARAYFSPSAQSKMDSIMSLSLAGTDDAKSVLKKFRDDALDIWRKLDCLKTLSYDSFSDVKPDDYISFLTNLEFHLNLCDTFDSEMVNEVIAPLDDSIKRMIDSLNALKAAIGTQRSVLRKTMECGRKFIDDFLVTAGFPYTVSFNYENAEKCSILLSPRDSTDIRVSDPASHLSYGEKNSLAVALFAAKAQHEKPDLVVLDDPISSFDDNKRYAILYKLFHSDGPLSGLTTLLLTHDFKTVLTLQKIHRDVLQGNVLSFMQNDNGAVSFLQIVPSNIVSIVKLCEKKTDPSNMLVTRLVYGRRLEELRNGCTPTYDYLSSLLHRLDAPSKKVGNKEYQELSGSLIAEAVAGLAALGLSDIDYEAALGELRNNGELIKKYCRLEYSNRYEKLGLLRIICANVGGKKELQERLGMDDIIWDCITSFYHCESEMIFQLDPMEYCCIPDYIFIKCDSIVNAIANHKSSV